MGLLGVLKLLVEIEGTADRVLGKLDRIAAELEVLMASAQEFAKVIAEIDAETTRIATVIDDLQKMIAGNGLDSATEAQVLSQMEALSAKLKTIGANPPTV